MKLQRLLFLFALLSVVAWSAEAPLYLFYPPAEVKVLEKAESNPTGDIATAIPKNEQIVPLLSNDQKSFVTMMPRDKRMAKFADSAYRQQLKSYGYAPLPVPLVWKSQVQGATDYEVTVSENKDFVPAVSVRTNNAQELTLRNLKIGTAYYWKVAAITATGKVESKPACFMTEGLAPRLVSIDGVPNVRDIGGRPGMGGKKVRQGMVYRTAGLNNNASPVYLPTDEVKKLHPERVKLFKPYRAYYDWLKKEARKPSDVTYVNYELSPSWTAYIPAVKPGDAQAYAFLDENAAPAEFLGAKPATVSPDKKGIITFGEPTTEYPAFLQQTIKADGDGYITLAIGCDWYFAIAVNNVPYCDNYMDKSGDGHSTVKKDNRILELPVRKGENLLSLIIWSGNVSWTAAIGKPSKTYTHKQLVEMTLPKQRNLAHKVMQVPDGTQIQPGKNRLNDDMKAYVVKHLGIRSDIDLRSDRECAGMTGSPATDQVKWFHISSSAYGGMKNESGKKAFTQVFKVFLDEKNYPLVFHCIAGQDRTGAVAFIINGLLGVDLEQLYLDWEETGFWNPDTGFNHEKRFNHLVAVFQELPGNTITEKVENYVLGLGFTKDDIAKLRSIMLEK